MGVLFGPRSERRSSSEFYDVGDVVRFTRDVRLNGSWSALSVTPDSVLTVPAVFAAQQLTAGTIFQLPFDEFRKTEDGRREVPASPLVAAPSGLVPAEEWRFQAVEAAQLHGNAVGVIVARDRLLYPTQVELVDPKRVLVKWDAQTRELAWKIDDEIVPADDIWHMPGRPKVGSPLGVGLVQFMAESAALGLAARRYAAAWFADGGAPVVVASMQKDPGATGAARLKEAIQTAISSRAPLVKPADVELSEWKGSKPSDAELVELLRQNSTDVAMFYALPPELIGGSTGDSMTYSNVEHRVLDLLAFGVSFWLIKLEKALTRSRPPGVYVKANEAAIIRTDHKTKVETLAAEIAAGLRTKNEGRKMLDLPALPGGDALGADEQSQSRSLSAAEVIQKIYLGVGKVITAEEARVIANAAGANLQIPGPTLGGSDGTSS